MQLKLMISEAAFKTKEESIKYIGAIKNNRKYKSTTKEVSIKELGRYLLHGHCIVPSILKEDKPLKDEYFSGAQVLGLDFDNTVELMDNGIKKKVRAGEGLYLTAKDILTICKAYEIKPFMIYETFSSTEAWRRYRLLFATKDIVTDIEYRRKVLQALIDIFSIDGVDTADTSCTDPSRVFFGGKTIVYKDEAYLDEVKAIEVADTINKNSEKKHDESASEASSNAALEGKGFSVHTYTNNNKYLSYVCTKNITLIKHRNYVALRSILGVENKEFSSFGGCINYITHEIDMAEFLGIQNAKSFSCIFHEDSDPSAGIIQLEDGKYFYKCFSSNCGFKGNIITVTAELIGSSRVEAIRFIQKVYNLNVVELEWAINYKEELKENIRMILDKEIKEIHPILDSTISRYYNDIICIHEFAMQNVLYKGNDNNIIFFVSQNKLASLLNTEQSSMCRRLALFALLKMVHKIDDEKIPLNLREKSKEISNAHNKQDTVQYYCIPSYTWGNLDVSNKRAEIYNSKHCTMKGMSREMIYRSFGKEVANEIYPKRQNLELTDESTKFKCRFEKCLLKLIANNGYATEKQIIAKLKGYKLMNEISAKRVLGQVLYENKLQRIRANKKLKQKYNINANGYPFIIIGQQNQ